jgi:GT2 family glycosyltransferase
MKSNFLIKPEPHIHVGIVTYNSAADLPTCLEALKAQTYPNWSLTVFNNAFKDDSLVIAQQYIPNARIIDNPTNLGFGRAHNAIIKACNIQPGDFYMPLNPDGTMTPIYMEKLVAVVQEKQAGWGTGKLLLQDDEHHPTNIIYSAGHGLLRGGYALNVGYHLPDGADFAEVRQIFGASGTCPVYRQEMIADISHDGNFFDAHMFMYLEDIDVDWRARRMGWQCWFVPDAIAYHSDTHLRGMLLAHSFANRYLGVIKNAYWQELVYTLPIMLMHIVMRLILTPKVGWLFVKTLVKNAPYAWRKRYRPVLTRAEFMEWTKWSAAQPTGQPKSVLARLMAFVRRFV